jgi:tubulin polyglutamylase TTLL4
MKKLFKNDYNFMSESYCYPRDQNQIYTKFNNYTLDLNNLWLIKPINRSVSSGIHFLSSLKEETKKRKKFLITKFISKLDLIDNKKYDLRLYALITGLKPLRLYFYKKGLVRKAVSVFNISKLGIHDKYMFLTNTGVNMENKKYIYTSKSDDTNANIWNLDTYKYYLKSKNVDFNIIFEKIKDITIKSVISFQKKLLIHNKDINERNVYTLLGIDILITETFEPILLEVNNRPSMHINGIIDKPIKTNLFADTLNIAGISLFSREKHYKNIKRNCIKDFKCH